MKQRSTTPVSKSRLARRLTIGLVAGVIAITGPMQFFRNDVSADKYDDKIAAIQRDIDAYQKEARSLASRSDTLQREIDSLVIQRNTIQAQIDLNQAEYERLQKRIEENKKRIESNRDALGTTLADMYVEGKISPLEMLASSSTIGDYLDRQEKLSSVRDTLKVTIEDINNAQAELEKQQKAVEVVLANQERNRDALASKEAEQKRLVRQTRGEEAAYQKMIKEGQDEQDNLRRQQAQQRAIEAAQSRAGGVTFIGGGSGGYPWSAAGSPGFPPCSVGYDRPGGDAYSRGGSDGRGGDGWGYGCRQCASYVAWKIGQHTGVIPTGVGHAKSFVDLGPNHYTARANSVGVMTAGDYGHVVWVETNPDANGYIVVSQYNSFDASQGGSGWGHFTRVKVHQSTYDAFIYY